MQRGCLPWWPAFQALLALMTSLSSLLANPALTERMTDAEPAVVADLLNRTPAAAFVPNDAALHGVAMIVQATRGAAQAQALTVLMVRGPALWEAMDSPGHLFLARQVGAHGDGTSVERLAEAWALARLGREVHDGLLDTVARHALLHRNAATWDTVVAMSPAQRTRPDRLRLAVHTAAVPDEFAWAWRFMDDTPWTERVEVAWAVLGKAWTPTPSRAVRAPAPAPAVAIGAAHRLLDTLPWDNPEVSHGVATMFNAPLSPFLSLIEHEYHVDPRVRLDALDGCVRLAQRLEERNVSLTWGSRPLRRAHERQQARFLPTPLATAAA